MDQSNPIEQLRNLNFRRKYIESCLSHSDSENPVVQRQCEAINDEITSSELAEPFASQVSSLATNAVIFWTFDEAPDTFQALTHCDGDEDWLAYVPPAIAAHDRWTNKVLSLIDDRKNIDYEVFEVLLPNGGKLFRGAH